MRKHYSLNEIFKHKFVLINQDGACSLPVNGIMREDKTGAILMPEDENLLKNIHTLRFYSSPDETHDYVISRSFRDHHRPLGKWLIKPFVVLF
ncbi:MAG: hypothetical protein ACRBDX_03985 [Gammaproteobacteria bacterium]